MKLDAVVVGGGIFGQTIAGWLRTKGVQALVIDEGQPYAGSKPSACLMKPSWLEAIRTEHQDQGYAVLDTLYGVHHLQFKVGPLKIDTVRWCDPKKIRQLHPVMFGSARRVEKGQVWTRVDGRIVVLEATHVIVAAGTWTNLLVPSAPKVEAKVGAACIWRNDFIPHNFISPWAPYRQLVGFQMGHDVWVGDGTAVNEKSWTAEREQAIMARCRKAVASNTGAELSLDEEESEFELVIGRRPYMDKKTFNGEPCYLRNHDGIWVATGGAKNGTIAAGWAAHRLAEMIA